MRKLFVLTIGFLLFSSISFAHGGGSKKGSGSGFKSSKSVNSLGTRKGGPMDNVGQSKKDANKKKGPKSKEQNSYQYKHQNQHRNGALHR